jgi:hypothetical protein
MYGAAVYGLFSNSNRFLMEVLGFNQERRVLAAAEHCTDCVGYASCGLAADWFTAPHWR